MERFWKTAISLDKAGVLACRYLVLFARGHTDANEWEGTWKGEIGNAWIEGAATMEEAQSMARERMADVPEILVARIFDLENLKSPFREPEEQPMWMLSD